MLLRPASLLAVVVLAASVVLMTGEARAAEFSAELHLAAPDETLNLELTVKGSSYRLEGEEEGQRRIVLRDRAAGTVTLVDPRAKEFEVLEGYRGAMSDPIFAWELSRKSLKKAELGTETIDGRECQHWRFTHPTQKDFKLEVWHSTKLDHFLKQTMDLQGQHKEMSLKKIVEAPVSPARLKPPPAFIRKKTPEEIEAALPSLSKVAKLEAPAGRRVSAGGELWVKLDPTRKVVVSAESRIAGESVVTAIPYRGGKVKENIGTNPWTLSRVGDRSTITWNDNFSMFGETFQIDEVRIKVEKGLCRVKVDQSAKDGKDEYLFGGSKFWGHVPTGGGSLTITGDHAAGPSSTGTLELVRKSGKSSEAFTLKNGQSRSWKLGAELQSFSVKVPLGQGGVKIRVR